MSGNSRPPDSSQLPLLMRRVREGVHSAEDLDRLMKLFHAGADPSQLRSLLRDKDKGVVKDGAFILSELGTKGQPFLPEAVRLLDDLDPWVRFWALESLLGSTAPGDGAAIMRCLLLLSDPDDRVQRKAFDFIARKSLPALAAGVRALPSSSTAANGVTDESCVGPALKESTRSPDAAVRARALTIAAMLFRSDSAIAREAAEDEDEEELAELARQCLKVRRR